MIQMVELTTDRMSRKVGVTPTSPLPLELSLFLAMGERHATPTPVPELYTSPTTVDIMTTGYSRITSVGVEISAVEDFVPVCEEEGGSEGPHHTVHQHCVELVIP